MAPLHDRRRRMSFLATRTLRSSKSPSRFPVTDDPSLPDRHFPDLDARSLRVRSTFIPQPVLLVPPGASLPHLDLGSDRGVPLGRLMHR
ncbi:hypothetical protein GBA52_023253 [Prunus armeniaca]|nr:hypothetical protein GBA52_023253 [Prunus armeniaca]